MPEEVVAVIGDYIVAAGAETVGDAIIVYSNVIAVAAQVASAVYTLRSAQLKAEKNARDAYNASLKDRYAMVRGATEQRQLVFGRQRVSGPVGFIKSYGTNNAKLVFTVILAAHEIDAVEAVYFDDEQVTLDGSGNVTGINRREQFSISSASTTVTLTATPLAGSVSAVAKYGTTTTTLGVSVSGTSVTVTGASSSATGLLVVTYKPDPNPYTPTDVAGGMDTFTIVTGSDTFTLSNPPNTGSVFAMQTLNPGSSINDQQDVALSTSVTGSNVTISGGTPGLTCTIRYAYSSAVNSKARVRWHLGGAGQTADATMISNLPGTWTSAHVGTGLAYLVVELDYDQAAFPNGVPNVSALVRGMKCYDPRSSTTAWTENPALLMRAYATHSLGGRLDASYVDDNAVIAAANACDASITYTVAGNSYVRPTYTAGITARTGVRPQDVLNDLALAMGGRWVFADGLLRVKAGAYTSPVMSLDESWLHNGGTVTVQPTRTRADVINTAQGTFADQDNDYQVSQYPKIVASAYVTADGAELPQDLNYAAITFQGQAQYVSSCQIRYARLGLTVKLTCNMRAYQAEVFDVINVSLARFGWVNKPFEVLDTAWTLDGGIELSLKAIDPSIWQMDAGFSAISPSPNTRLPSPWGLPPIAGLTVVSGSTTVFRQADGTIVPRLKASWTAITDPRITNEGQIELRWGLASDTEDKWFSTLVSGTATSVYLDGVKVGRVYSVRARTVGAISASGWCAQVLVSAAGKTTAPSDVTGLTIKADQAGVQVLWTQPTDPDYQATEVRVGSTWSGGTTLFKGHANAFRWTWQPASGVFYVRARHIDTSGNYSSADAVVTVYLSSTQLATGAAIEGAGTGASSFTVTAIKHTPDGVAWRDQVMGLTITPTVTGMVNVIASARVSLSGGSNYSYFALWDASDPNPIIGTGDSGAADSVFRILGACSFPVVAGTSYTFGLYCARYNSAQTMVVDDMSMEAQVVAAQLLVDQRSTASNSKGSGMMGHSATLSYAAGTVGRAINDGTLAVVVGTGVGATDVAAIQNAINIAPANGVIGLKGAITLNASVILKPTIKIVNAGGAIVTVTGNFDAFVLQDDVYNGSGNGSIAPAGMVWTGTVALDGSTRRVLDGYPGRISIEGIKCIGPLTGSNQALPANNQQLGTFTVASHPACIRLNYNGQQDHIFGNWVESFDAGIFLVNAGAPTVKNNRIINCKVGLLPGKDVHNGTFDNWIEQCFIGLGFNYGGLSQFTHGPNIGGVIQYCYVAHWYEGVYEAVAPGPLYCEGNAFRDIQWGWGGSAPYRSGGQCVGFQVSTLLTSSACNNQNGGGAGVDYQITLSPNDLPANAKHGANISCASGTGLHIKFANFNTGSPTGTRWVMHTDSNGEACSIGYYISQSTNPFKFEDVGRVVVKRGEKLRFGRNKDYAFWSYPLAWGDPGAARWGGHDDPNNSASQAGGVKNFLSFDYRYGTSRYTLTLGGTDSTSAGAGDGGEVSISGSIVFINTMEAVPRPLMYACTGPTEWGADVGKMHFTALSTVYFDGVAAITGTFYMGGTTHVTGILAIDSGSTVYAAGLPTGAPGISGQLYVDASGFVKRN